MSRVRRSGGFSLMELMVVLLVMGIMAAAAAPALVSLAHGDGEASAAAQLEALLRGTRAAAVEGGAARILILEPATGRYWTFSEAGEGAPEEGQLHLAAGERLESAEPRVRYRFAPDGAATGGPLLVRGPGGPRVLRVDAWTGMVYAGAR